MDEDSVNPRSKRPRTSDIVLREDDEGAEITNEDESPPAKKCNTSDIVIIDNNDCFSVTSKLKKQI